MNIEAKLKDLCSATDGALKTVNKRTQKLFSDLSMNIKNENFSFSDDYKDHIQEINRCGLAFDSASFILEKILDSNKARLVDISLRGLDRDINTLNPYINTVLEEHNQRDRSFVYFAWRGRPEEYYYVGKAKSRSRTNLAQHGNLLESLKQASSLAIIFPAISTDENIKNLEAALIHLVEYKTGEIPKYNKRKESFNMSYECRSEAREIKKLISSIHREFN